LQYLANYILTNKFYRVEFLQALVEISFAFIAI